jgi:hypothetical protein
MNRTVFSRFGFPGNDGDDSGETNDAPPQKGHGGSEEDVGDPGLTPSTFPGRLFSGGLEQVREIERGGMHLGGKADISQAEAFLPAPSTVLIKPKLNG